MSTEEAFIFSVFTMYHVFDGTLSSKYEPGKTEVKIIKYYRHGLPKKITVERAPYSYNVTLPKKYKPKRCSGLLGTLVETLSRLPKKRSLDAVLLHEIISKTNNMVFNFIALSRSDQGSDLFFHNPDTYEVCKIEYLRIYKKLSD